MANIPSRKDVKIDDTWDLTKLYATRADWDADLNVLQNAIDEASRYCGKLGESPATLLEALKWLCDVSIVAEKLYVYASLNYSADASDSENQKMIGIISQIYTNFIAATSYMTPELLTIADLPKWVEEKEFDDYRVYLKKTLRQKAHTLSQKEEELLAKQSELMGTPQKAFGVLTNVDMNFGEIDGMPLSQSTWSVFMQNPNRDVRKKPTRSFMVFIKVTSKQLQRYMQALSNRIFSVLRLEALTQPLMQLF